MKLVKLDAIDSTNDYLKDLVRKELLENYSVVTAELQTNGKVKEVLLGHQKKVRI